MDIAKKLQEELQLKAFQVENTIKLIDEGNTIPFIARYRKEVTGSLNDEVLRNFHERLVYLRTLEDKKAQIIKSIDEQGKLTHEIKLSIEKAETLVEIEDIYRPYRPKRTTRASIAKEKGLQPLADIIWGQDITKALAEIAKGFINTEKEVNTTEDAIKGAMDILAERISDDADTRKMIRRYTFINGFLIAKATDAEKQSVYEMYYDYKEPVRQLVGHRILAINRGESEKILSVKIDVNEEIIIDKLKNNIIQKQGVETAEVLEKVILDAYKRLIFPAIEREIRNELTDKAQEGAIKVFGKNLGQTLMQPPIKGKTVMGIDPAYRTGCKIAVVDGIGKVLDTTVVYPTPPQSKVAEAKATLKKLIEKHNVDVLSIGNGTASRETEAFAAELIKEIDKPLCYAIVNEAGASVYSASKLATEEFPQFDVGQRSAASIARRLQDPLAELVKIDPQSIGVGQYQHDMNKKKLDEALSGVVENAVNTVGVDVNTASVPLLKYVAGVNESIAKNIVLYRETVSPFKTRKELLKVKKLGAKAFEQCAGFLRIPNSEEVLDNTAIHPESYAAVNKLLTTLNISVEELIKQQFSKKSEKELEPLASEIGVGTPTLIDILKEIEKPGRDPREEMPRPILRSDVLSMEDLKPGMILEGVVRNIVDFGAFVDIGVHQDGLVHLSQMADRYIKHPMEVVSVGDIIKVKILDVDLKKNRIQLTMKMQDN